MWEKKNPKSQLEGSQARVITFYSVRDQLSVLFKPLIDWMRPH